MSTSVISPQSLPLGLDNMHGAHWEENAVDVCRLDKSLTKITQLVTAWIYLLVVYTVGAQCSTVGHLVIILFSFLPSNN